MIPKRVVVRSSAYSVKETIDRLQTFLQQHGATIYARINQQLEVRKAGLELSPLEFLMFGNPKTGGSVIAENPLVALDLPMKIIAWEDDQKEVWLAYNDATYIEERYSLSSSPGSPFALDALVDAALEK